MRGFLAMSAPDRTHLHALADHCVNLVARQFNRQLDWSPESRSALDEVCTDLLADGPIADQAVDLWWQLIGAYTGEVVIRPTGARGSSTKCHPELLRSRHLAWLASRSA
jgi:hypothetical protein